MQKLESHLQQFPGLRVVPVESSQQAVRGADIVTTCTADKTWATILTPDMVEPGMHINGIGGDCPGKTELHGDVLRDGKIFVEYEPQTRIEGDIQQLPETHPVHDLWRVIAGEVVGRDNDEQITIFDSVGFALEDFSALTYVHRLATELNEGIEIELVPTLRDPKNLFERLVDGAGRTQTRKAA
jgi:ornithine cyclodeaminase